MTRNAAFVVLMLLTSPAFGQVPPGFPFDATRHPNPILTYIETKNFQTATYAEAEKRAEIELLGLFTEVGRLQSIEIAGFPTATQRVRILGRNVDVVFYPAVRQTFTLSGGARFVLHSFKFPRAPLPVREAADILNESAFARTRNPAEQRFGLAAAPERLQIRGGPALFFADEQDRTIFWVENGVAHTATVPASEVGDPELLKLLDDLL